MLLLVLIQEIPLQLQLCKGAIAKHGCQGEKGVNHTLSERMRGGKSGEETFNFGLRPNSDHQLFKGVIHVEEKFLIPEILLTPRGGVSGR